MTARLNAPHTTALSAAHTIVCSLLIAATVIACSDDAAIGDMLVHPFFGDRSTTFIVIVEWREPGNQRFEKCNDNSVIITADQCPRKFHDTADCVFA